MHVRDKVVVVTGGASGIGRSLVHRFVLEGARVVVAADIDAERAATAASDAGAAAESAQVDVANEASMAELIGSIEDRHGAIDLFCSNAGIYEAGGVDTPQATWQRMLDVNFMAQVYVARHLIPRMIGRGGGYLLVTASAAGLLSQIGSVTYAVTKHAAVAFAEWISITHGEEGIKVSVLCPQAVRTPMLTSGEGSVATVDGVMEPDQVADAVVDALAAERFLVLPHPEVAEYARRRGEDRERWLAGMRRLQARYRGLS